MPNGIVSKFNSKRGWGFVTATSPSADNGKQVFIHQNDINDDGFRCLYEDEEVSFDIEEKMEDGEVKYQGKNVNILTRSPRRNRNFNGGGNRNFNGGGNRNFNDRGPVSRGGRSPSPSQIQALQARIERQEAIISRLLKVMGEETEDGSMLGDEDIAYIRGEIEEAPAG